MVLVEGESDCHTLWHHGFAALGVPGPTNWNEGRDVPNLDGISKKVTNWFGMVVPAATPRDIVTRLHGEILKVLRLPDVRDSLIAQGTEPVGSSPEAFGAFMKSEAAKWARVIKEANIRAD